MAPASDAALHRQTVKEEREIIPAAQLAEELLKHEVAESLIVIFWRGETEVEATIRVTERPSMAGY